MIEGAEPPAGAVILPGTELIIRRSSGPVGHNQPPSEIRHGGNPIHHFPTTEHD
jgi:hypothetical protein